MFSIAIVEHTSGCAGQSNGSRSVAFGQLGPTVARADDGKSGTIHFVAGRFANTNHRDYPTGKGRRREIGNGQIFHIGLHTAHKDRIFML